MLNYAEVVDLRLVGGRVRGAEVRDRLSGDTVSVEARAVVNATGPWLDRLRRLEQPGVAPYGQLSKGVHVTLPLDRPWSAALTIPHDQVRVTFAYPWEGMLLLGTTDTPYDGDPADVAATDEDVDQVLAEAGVAVDHALLARERVLSTYAGPAGASPQRRLDGRRAARDRVPARQGRDAHGRRREADDVPPHRARRARPARLRARPGEGRPRVPCPCPGRPTPATSLPACGRGGRSSPTTAAHLAHFYGTRADGVVGLAAERPELLEPIHPGAPDIAAQVVFAAREEWATSADDVVHRRTTLGRPRSRHARRARPGRPPARRLVCRLLTGLRAL